MSEPSPAVSWHRRYDAYLFDLDGTLIDTAPDIDAALNHTLTHAGFASVEEDLTRHWVGHGARVLIQEALTYQAYDGDFDAKSESMLADFLTYYGEHLMVHSKPYPGVIDTLHRLRQQGAKLAVVTNKMSALTNPLIAQTEMADLFDLLVSGDTAASPKPAADPVLYCLDQLGIAGANALFIGDSETDVLAAKAAKVRVVCVRDGYNHGVDVAKLGADGVIDGFADLLC